MTDPATGTTIVFDDVTIPLPRAILSDIVPAMTDVAEIQAFLATVRLAIDTGDLATPVDERTIVRDRTLRDALRVVGNGNGADLRIATGLDLAVGRGVLLRFRTTSDGDERVWYVIATAEARLAVDRMLRGETSPPRTVWSCERAPEVAPERPTIFRLYEQNIGLLSPIITDQLIQAMERYPRDWIEDAIGEAVAYNRRNWRYIQRILQNWAATGRTSERPGNGRE